MGKAEELAAAVEGLGKRKRRNYPGELRQQIVDHVFAKRLDKGRFAAIADRSRGRSVKMTLSELTQFIEGSERIGRSPALLTWADLAPRWLEPGKK